MAMNFAQNFNMVPQYAVATSAWTMRFFGFNFEDSVSLNTFNALITWNNAGNARTVTLSFGLYSLSGSTLSIANSWSVSTSNNGASKYYISASTFSATQNITPGTWYIGMLGSIDTTNVSQIELFGGSAVPFANAFPGSFTGGRGGASTTALPASVNTTTLDITGADASWVPYVLISA